MNKLAPIGTGIAFCVLALNACGGGGGLTSGTEGTNASPSDYSVGGTIRGLDASGLVLADGGNTDSITNGATSFAFSTQFPSGTAYNVTVQTQPSGKTCAVAYGSGTVASSDIASVVITCSEVSPTETVHYSFRGPTADGYQPTDLIAGSDGNFYGVTAGGGQTTTVPCLG